jgi:hypothetical protein
MMKETGDPKQGKQEGFDIVLEKTTDAPHTDAVPQSPAAVLPPVFCASKELAKEILIEITALAGAMHGIELGELDPGTSKVVLSNGQRILLNLGEILVRDCNLTETDMNDVAKVFEMATPQPTLKKE